MSSQPPKLTDWQVSEWNRRKHIVDGYHALLSEDSAISTRQAALKLGVSATKLGDLLNRFLAKHDANDLIPDVSTGRKSVKAKLEAAIGSEVVDEAFALVKGHVLDTGTVSGSWRLLAKTGQLPEAIAQVILDPTKASKHHLPQSLTKATTISSAIKLAHQGRRALKHSGLYTPRRVDVLPGDVFVADDTTPIWGWWVPWPKSKLYPFGRKMLQGQLLLLIDYATGYRIGYTLIARERSSYRACDIWAFYGKVFDDVGLPRLGFQHEGGAWQAMLIRGQKIETESGEPDYDRRAGAIEGLPSTLLPFHHEMARGMELRNTLRIWRSVEARSKPVEGAFRMMQPIEGTIWGYLGTDQRRNPIIKTKKIFEACQRNSADPGLHFLSGLEMMKRLTPIMNYLNDDFMEGPIRQGKPDAAWNASLSEHALTKLAPEQRWLYQRDWAVRTLSGPYINCSYRDPFTGNNVPLFYENAELCAQHCDKQVVIYYDKQYPTKPAHIVTPDYQWLGQAEYFSPPGAFLAINKEGFENAANYNSCVMQMTKIIEQRCPSHQIPPEIAARRQEAEALKRAEQQTPLSVPRGSARSVCPAPSPESTEVAPAAPRRVAKSLAEIVAGDLPPIRISPPGSSQMGMSENVTSSAS